MIDHPKYKIPKFEALASHKDVQPNAELRFAVYTACLYYEFAYYRMLDFCTVTNDMYKARPEQTAEIDSYLYRAWSDAYAMYALLRTTIDAVRRINSAVLKKDVDVYYRNRIKDIVDVANDAVKHPTFNGAGSYAHRPLSLDIAGNIEIQRWADQVSSSTEFTISPEKDFYAVQNYLEHVADLICGVE